MSPIIIQPEAIQKSQEAQLPKILNFGSTPAPVMYKSIFDGKTWGSRELLATQDIPLNPFGKNLHYAQQVFEGLKAYRTQKKQVHFFRPLENAKRLNRSGARLCMQPVPEEIFMEGIEYVTKYSRQVIPQESGSSLYLRPFSMGIDPILGMASSKTYVFYVIASPSQCYHSGTMKVLIQRDSCRATIGGTGAAKTAVNYGASILANHSAQKLGYDQVLWLDPQKLNLIEELSGMNIFAVIDGEIHTPQMTTSFLQGITRDSVIILAKHMGYKVIERPMPVDDLLADILSGSCTEVFACGTATVISPISLIADSDKREYLLPDCHTSSKILKNLLGIQEGLIEDPFGWIVPLKN